MAAMRNIGASAVELATEIYESTLNAYLSRPPGAQFEV